MHLEYPDTDKFKEFKKLITENAVDNKNHAYDSFFLETVEKDKTVFDSDEYFNWVKCNMKHLKYVYFEEVLENDWMGVMPLAVYCMKAYVVYLHNKKMESFEDIRDEIEGLTKP